MSRAGTIARRTFLIGSAAIAGGAVFGTWLVKRDPGNPLDATLAEGETALTPFVKIDASGVTIITPRTEMGQGAQSVLAQIAAEELDLDWAAVKIEHGPPGAAYYNSKVAVEGMPVKATDTGTLAAIARGAGDAIAKVIGLQITGGSSSVADAFDRLRASAASARFALVEAAARQSGQPASALKTEGGAVILPDGSALPYPALAAAASGIALPSEPPMKPRDQWRILGKPVQRLDVVAKSTGTATFGIDMAMDGMVYATARTNPRIGGAVRSIDDTAAKTMRGVLAVVPITGGIGVIADNTWRAFRAAEAVDIEWGEAPYPATSAEMFAAIEASFNDDNQDSRFRDDGDVETTLAAASAVIEAEYRIPALAHAPLEPMSAVVKVDADRVDIWAGTQIPGFVRAMAAKLTGKADEQVHVHTILAGGSFGRRLEDDYIRQAVEIAMAMPGKPVKMVWRREEDMTHDPCRPPAIARMRGSVTDGRIEALDARFASASVNASQIGRLGLPAAGPDIAIVAGAWDQPFALPHYRVTGYRAPEMAPISSWRSVGASGNGFFHECFMDELCLAAGADPVAERLRLVSHEPSRKVIEAVAELANWGRPVPNGHGRGFAFTLSFGVPVAEIVDVRMTDAGIVIDDVFAVADVGIALDPVNIEAQLSGGVLWGLSHAIHGEITHSDGMIEQTNFDTYEALRLYQVPRITTRILETMPTIRGIGEPGVPPAAPALANAIFAATGQRIREMPLKKAIDFA